MTLQRAQIDVLLEDLEATAWRRHRADPADPTLPRDIVAQARALLRDAALDQHLYICDYAQHLLLRLNGDADGEADAESSPPGDGFLRAVRPTRDAIPDLGIALVDDPFDLDAYVPQEPAGASMPVRMLQAPEAVRVLAPQAQAQSHSHSQPQPQPQAPATERRVAGPGERDLRRGLTAQQLQTLDTMAHFGWTLRFVRRPPFQPPVPVAFDRNRERFVVIAPDGGIDDAPDLRIRR
jgi:hypothetical protein